MPEYRDFCTACGTLRTSVNNTPHHCIRHCWPDGTDICSVTAVGVGAVGQQDDADAVLRIDPDTGPCKSEVAIRILAGQFAGTAQLTTFTVKTESPLIHRGLMTCKQRDSLRREIAITCKVTSIQQHLCPD